MVAAPRDALAPATLTVVVNVGDDLTWFGLWVWPDVDAILYALAGCWDGGRGWGVRGDGFRVGDRLAALAAEPWFHVGDLDLALHLLRTELLRSGRTLTEAIAELGRRLGVGQAMVVPASDEPCETHVELDDGRLLHFQEWYMREKAQPPVRRVRLAEGPAAPAALRAVRDADAVIFGPCSPVASVQTILALTGMADAVRAVPRRVAVSPVVVGAPVTTPPATTPARGRLLAADDDADTPVIVARRYADFRPTVVLDSTDAGFGADVVAMGLEAVTCHLLIPGDLAATLVRWSLTG